MASTSKLTRAVWPLLLTTLAMLIGMVPDGLAQPADAPAPANLRWVRSASGYAPPQGAYVGGMEDGVPLYVCRAPYASGVYPGKLVKGNCNISYDNKEIPTRDFEILVGAGGQWGAPAPNSAGAFVAGGENGGPLYLCQAPYKGGVHPGKVYHYACHISYAGDEVPVREFAVLYAGIMTAPGTFDYRFAAPSPPAYGAPAGGYNPPQEIQAAGAGSVLRYENTDFPGNDLAQSPLPSPSFQDCANRCLADSRCGAFTYNMESRTCWPKSFAGVPQPFNNAASGVISLGQAPQSSAPVMAFPASCSIGGTSKCPGCSVTCNPGQRAVCTQPVEGVTSFCARNAQCSCSP